MIALAQLWIEPQYLLSSAVQRIVSSNYAGYVESDYPVCSFEAYQQGQVMLTPLPAPSEAAYQVFGLDETPHERGCMRVT